VRTILKHAVFSEDLQIDNKVSKVTELKQGVGFLFAALLSPPEGHTLIEL
jgi:hypothetical protein